MEKKVAKYQNCLEADSLSNSPKPPTFRGRSFGITALTVAQLLIGSIHIFSGALLFSFENFSALPIAAAYDIYTLSYGLIVLFFAILLWRSKKPGWIGTIAVSLFVIVADTLTLLDYQACLESPSYQRWLR
jgi:hypothetical protein